MNRQRLALALVAAGGLLSPRVSAAQTQPAVAVTTHRGVFNGHDVTYLATVAETVVFGPAGASAATLVTTSYVRQGVGGSTRRPVIFAFNGGPGASSSPLHLNALGPRRYGLDATGERVLRDNPFSPLDAADLVFVDPVGTGFSTPRPGVNGQPFWSVTGDADSVAAVIATWLRVHHRESSPRYLCGESYGTTRAAQVVSTHAALRFDGVLLLSMVGGPADPDESLAALVPTFAAAAAFHGVTGASGRSPGEIFDEASAFARGPYLTALRQGSRLPETEVRRMAAELGRRIGLPASVVAERQLRIGREEFMLTLLAARGLRTGQLDARQTGVLAEFAGKTPPYDDPSMPGARPFTRPTAHRYFTEELGFPARTPYVPLNLDINATWRFDSERAMQDPVGLVADAMRTDSRLRLFWIGGLYDLTTPLASGRYLFDRAGVPADRVTVLAEPTGHMPYEGDEALARFTEAVRRFTRASR